MEQLQRQQRQMEEARRQQQAQQQQTQAQDVMRQLLQYTRKFCKQAAWFELQIQNWWAIINAPRAVARQVVCLILSWWTSNWLISWKIAIRPHYAQYRISYKCSKTIKVNFPLVTFAVNDEYFVSQLAFREKLNEIMTETATLTIRKAAIYIKNNERDMYTTPPRLVHSVTENTISMEK